MVTAFTPRHLRLVQGFRSVPFCPALHLQHKRTRKRDYDASAAHARSQYKSTKRKEGEKKIRMMVVVKWTADLRKDIQP